MGKVKFKTLESGCIIPINRKLNYDGYYRVPSPTKILKNGKKARVMYHRLLWEQKHGSIPSEYSLHHTCHNRACCNLDHLILLPKTEHAKLHNSERYGDRKREAKEYWLQHKCTGTYLASLFGVSFGIGCRWIREWKQEEHESA